ncbi:MAG: hypothetical protein HY923_10750 [Elusimicrobia bacterium]|nr:hypothetical protein [Elusimicrobiota bacterium]
MLKIFAVLAASAVISGCVIYPTKSDDYDPDCQVNSMVLTLDSTELGLDCSGGDPRACLAIIGAVGPASAVVSGSIYVIGNTLHWLAHKGRCVLAPDKPEPPKKI